VVAEGIIATNCHVLRDANSFLIKQGREQRVAYPSASDANRDVCLLSAPGLKAPQVRLGKSVGLAVGSKVYAIGAPKGLALTFSDGLVSGFRPAHGGQYVQITAAISPGSSGGGLFDEDARLIGLPTFYVNGGQQLNFAVPVEWVVELLGGQSRVEQPQKESEIGTDDALLLRCVGSVRSAARRDQPLMESDLGPRKASTLTLTLDLIKNEITASEPILLYSTDSEGNITGKAKLIVTQDAFYAKFPEKFKPDGVETIVGSYRNSLRVDRISGELLLETSSTNKTLFGDSHLRSSGIYRCEKLEKRAF
jgi:hypothetical protein